MILRAQMLDALGYLVARAETLSERYGITPLSETGLRSAS